MALQHFPLLTNTTYLNTAYVGLMSSELASFRRDNETFYVSNGGDHYKIKAYEELAEIHQKMSSFLGLVPNVVLGFLTFHLELEKQFHFYQRDLKFY